MLLEATLLLLLELLFDVVPVKQVHGSLVLGIERAL
jgi:hypothetical protein